MENRRSGLLHTPSSPPHSFAFLMNYTVQCSRPARNLKDIYDTEFGKSTQLSCLEMNSLRWNLGGEDGSSAHPTPLFSLYWHSSLSTYPTWNYTAPLTSKIGTENTFTRLFQNLGRLLYSEVSPHPSHKSCFLGRCYFHYRPIRLNSLSLFEPTTSRTPGQRNVLVREAVPAFFVHLRRIMIVIHHDIRVQIDLFLRPPYAIARSEAGAGRRHGL